MFFPIDYSKLMIKLLIFSMMCIISCQEVGDGKSEPDSPDTDVEVAGKRMERTSLTSGIPANTGIDNRVVQVVDYLTSEESPLNDPASYAPIKWYQVYVNGDSSQFTVNHEFRAKDEDGVYRRYGKQFLLDDKGKVVGMQDPG